MPVATLVQSSSTKASAALGSVREELKKKRLDAFIIPSADEHLSEYAADHFCRRVSDIIPCFGRGRRSMITHMHWPSPNCSILSWVIPIYLPPVSGIHIRI